jgi:O-antigen/teichoic acid export membrane protein
MTDVLPGDPTDPVALESQAALADADAGPPPAGRRTRERERRILRSGVASSAHQVLSALCTLVAVPLVIRRLPAEEFGVWITLSAVIILLGFLDLGVGSALVGRMARAQAVGDRDHAQEMLSSAFYGLAAVSALLAAVFWLVYPHVSWATLLGVESAGSRQAAATSVAVVVAGILLSVPLSVAARAQTGLQEGEAVVLWRTSGTVVQLVATVVLYLADAGLVWFVLALTAGPVLGSLLNTVALFTGSRRWLRARWSRASLETFRGLGSTGFLFFLLLLASTMAYQSDALVVAHFLGSAEAGQYGVPFRLFMFVPSIVSIALVPLWPAYADAWEGGDGAWIRRTFWRSLGFALAANGAAGLGLLVLARPLLRLWVGDAVHPTTTFLVAMVVYVLVWGASGSIAMLLNGCNGVKFQLVVAVAMLAVNVPLSIALLDPLGVAGPVVGTIVAQAVMVLIPAAFYIPALLRRVGPAPATAAQAYWRSPSS